MGHDANILWGRAKLLAGPVQAACISRNCYTADAHACQEALADANAQVLENSIKLTV